MAGKKNWWVAAIAYPAQPDTAYPYYFQAESQAEATKIVGGAPLAGPFATRAEAVAWATGPGRNEFGKGKTNIAPPAAPGATHVPVPAIPGLPNPLGWLQGIGHWIGEAVAHILDVHMWRSIGWITMGVVLLVLGIFLWLRRSDLIEPLPRVQTPLSRGLAREAG